MSYGVKRGIRCKACRDASLRSKRRTRNVMSNAVRHPPEQTPRGLLAAPSLRSGLWLTRSEMAVGFPLVTINYLTGPELLSINGRYNGRPHPTCNVAVALACTAPPKKAEQIERWFVRPVNILKHKDCCTALKFCEDCRKYRSTVRIGHEKVRKRSRQFDQPAAGSFPDSGYECVLRTHSHPESGYPSR